MTNNDILRRIRYAFDFRDNQMIKFWTLSEYEVTDEQVSNWLRKDDHPDYEPLNDKKMAHFLDGFIIDKRGRKDGPLRKPENRLTNNIILNKLKIALSLTADDVIEILQLADLRVSKSELSAFFRRPDHKHYRQCNDQILRNFLNGLQIKHRKSK